MLKDTGGSWHVSIEMGEGKAVRRSVVNDLTYEQLRAKIVEPWHAARPFTVSGLLVRSPDLITSIRIQQTPHPSAVYAGQHDARMQASGIADFATDRKYLVFKQGVDYTQELLFETPTPLQNENPLMPPPDPKKVFIIHGRNTAARTAVEHFLKALGLQPVDFDQLAADQGGTPFVGDIVRAGLEQAHGIIALFTSEEYAALRPDHRGGNDSGTDVMRWQARPNVIFEAGMAYGMAPKRTILATLGTDVSLFSDVAGVHILRLSNEVASRERFRHKLIGIGCEVEQRTSAWTDPMRSGDFDACISRLQGGSPRDPF